MTDEALGRLADALADRYLLEEELGRGASATVYLAQDLRHGRRVALKVLHSALGAALGVERFQREIRTQARLHHPHILPLFDSGSAAGRLYYVMPYVETGSLRDRLRGPGRLSVGAAVQVGREVASALSYAHALGVIHRDLKPENILISSTGFALLTDFGIAYAVDSATNQRLTESGVTLGTPAYMSPEQSAGDEIVDARSDLYSLATVLYEAITGRPPFEGANARALMVRRLTELATPIREVRPDVPASVERALDRALARQPDDRFESVDAFATVLATADEPPPTPAPSAPPTRRSWLPRGISARWAGAVAALVLAAAAVAAGLTLRRGAAGGVSGPRVVAVLPFKNLGPPGDQYFADGLTEEITSRLAGLSGLRVISRTSADQYRSSTQSVRAIGAELGADYVLEGSVRWARDRGGVGRLRVTPQLIRVRDDSHLWAATYEAALGEVFRLQSEIAERVTVALDVALRAPERAALAATGTQNCRGVRLLPQGHELPRPHQPGLRPAERGAAVRAGGCGRSRPSPRPCPAEPGARADLLASLRPHRRPAQAGQAGGRDRAVARPGRARDPRGARLLSLLGRAGLRGRASASSSSRAGSSRATASCSRRSATSSAGRAAGRSRSRASWRRCATIRARASATSRRATTTSRSTSIPRPSTTSTARGRSRPTGTIRTSTWRGCT